MENRSAPVDRNAHVAAAETAYERLFSSLPSASGYQLSQCSAERQGLDRVTELVDLTYGDVPFHCISRVLDAAEPPVGGLVVDLGSGVGRGVMAIALLRQCRCLGVELLTDLHEAALEPARRFEALRASVGSGEVDAELSALDGRLLASAVEFRCADLFDVAVSDASLVFCCCVTWGPAIMERLAAKLANELSEGAAVVTVGQELPELVDLGDKCGAVRFERAWHSIEQLEWGREAFTMHRVAKVGELLARRYRRGKRTKHGKA
jgi:SAM-dependent methyltransferase